MIPQLYCPTCSDPLSDIIDGHWCHTCCGLVCGVPDSSKEWRNPIYISLRPHYQVAKTVEVVPGSVFVDYDADGNAIGIEVLDWLEVRSDAFEKACKAAMESPQ